MFTTNVAARGLDFPRIQWVIQVDRAEDVQTYVHRVGRTARFVSSGKALSFLDPSEEDFLEKLQKNGISVKKVAKRESGSNCQLHANPQKEMTIRKSLQGLCTQFPDIKYLAQKAVICQLKSLYHRGNQSTRLLTHVDLAELAKSHGLIQAPKISFKTAGTKDTEQNAGEEGTTAKAGNKKSKKLEKLKRKIKMKKEKLKRENAPDIEDKFLTKNIDDQLNELRENPAMTRGKEFIQVEDTPLEGFLTKRKGPVEIGDLDLKKVKFSKRKFKKIKKEGPFDGKNIREIDNRGKIIGKMDSFKMKFKGGPLEDRVGQFKSKLGRC